MDDGGTQHSSVESYIASFPHDVAVRLSQLRALIRDMVPPGTKEVISYNIPGYKKPGGGRAYIYFAGFDGHLSLYPIHPQRTGFAKELKPYLSGRATLRFSHDKPLPITLIKKSIKFLIDSYA